MGFFDWSDAGDNNHVWSELRPEPASSSQLIKWERAQSVGETRLVKDDYLMLVLTHDPGESWDRGIFTYGLLVRKNRGTYNI